MAIQEPKIIIETDLDGSFNIEVINGEAFKNMGTTCTQATQPIEDALGDVGDRTMTGDATLPRFTVSTDQAAKNTNTRRLT